MRQKKAIKPGEVIRVSTPAPNAPVLAEPATWPDGSPRVPLGTLAEVRNNTGEPTVSAIGDPVEVDVLLGGGDKPPVYPVMSKLPVGTVPEAPRGTGMEVQDPSTSTYSQWLPKSPVINRATVLPANPVRPDVAQSSAGFLQSGDRPVSTPEDYYNYDTGASTPDGGQKVAPPQPGVPAQVPTLGQKVGDAKNFYLDQMLKRVPPGSVVPQMQSVTNLMTQQATQPVLTAEQMRERDRQEISKGFRDFSWSPGALSLAVWDNEEMNRLRAIEDQAKRAATSDRAAAIGGLETQYGQGMKEYNLPADALGDLERAFPTPRSGAAAGMPGQLPATAIQSFLASSSPEVRALGVRGAMPMISPEEALRIATMYDPSEAPQIAKALVEFGADMVKGAYDPAQTSEMARTGLGIGKNAFERAIGGNVGVDPRFGGANPNVQPVDVLREREAMLRKRIDQGIATASDQMEWRKTQAQLGAEVRAIAQKAAADQALERIRNESAMNLETLRQGTNAWAKSVDLQIAQLKGSGAGLTPQQYNAMVGPLKDKIASARLKQKANKELVDGYNEANKQVAWFNSQVAMLDKADPQYYDKVKALVNTVKTSTNISPQAQAFLKPDAEFGITMSTISSGDMGKSLAAARAGLAHSEEEIAALSARRAEIEALPKQGASAAAPGTLPPLVIQLPSQLRALNAGRTPQNTQAPQQFGTAPASQQPVRMSVGAPTPGARPGQNIARATKPQPTKTNKAVKGGQGKPKATPKATSFRQPTQAEINTQAAADRAFAQKLLEDI